MGHSNTSTDILFEKKKNMADHPNFTEPELVQIQEKIQIEQEHYLRLSFAMTLVIMIYF